MAEQEQSKKEPPISGEDLVRYLEARHASMKCPHCGAEEWGSADRTALQGAALPRLGPDALVYQDSILPVLTLACGNCSYLWLIARKLVAYWLAQNPEQHS